MILILILVIPFYGCATESEEVVKRPSKPRVKHIYLENEQIYGYFEPTHMQAYQKLIPSIYSMPERPLCRVAVIDFYKMESAPPYLKLIGAVSCKQALHDAGVSFCCRGE